MSYIDMTFQRKWKQLFSKNHLAITFFQFHNTAKSYWYYMHISEIFHRFLRIKFLWNKFLCLLYIFNARCIWNFYVVFNQKGKLLFFLLVTLIELQSWLSALLSRLLDDYIEINILPGTYSIFHILLNH